MTGKRAILAILAAALAPVLCAAAANPAAAQGANPTVRLPSTGVRLSITPRVPVVPHISRHLARRVLKQHLGGAASSAATDFASGEGPEAMGMLLPAIQAVREEPK